MSGPGPAVITGTVAGEGNCWLYTVTRDEGRCRTSTCRKQTVVCMEWSRDFVYNRSQWWRCHHGGLYSCHQKYCRWTFCTQWQRLWPAAISDIYGRDFLIVAWSSLWSYRQWVVKLGRLYVVNQGPPMGLWPSGRCLPGIVCVGRVFVFIQITYTAAKGVTVNISRHVWRDSYICHSDRVFPGLASMIHPTSWKWDSSFDCLPVPSKRCQYNRAMPITYEKCLLGCGNLTFK